ncbi:MAG: hypothetical protein N4A40_09935 [Tissierellales bacterium]|jgi:seryl-tRNA synthetase|nr:hypothetical protein [Tissierellales bacterium]
MKNRDLLKIQAGIEVLSNIKDVKFSWCLLRNKKKIKAELETIQEALNYEKVEGTDKYDEERKEILDSHIEYDQNNKPIKDEVGNLIFKNGKTKDELESRISELNDKYPEVDKQLKEYEEKQNELLDSDCELELYKIKFDNLPENIAMAELELIEELIDE